MVLRGQPVGEQGAADRWTALDPHPAGSGAGGAAGGSSAAPPFSFPISFSRGPRGALFPCRGGPRPRAAPPGRLFAGRTGSSVSAAGGRTAPSSRRAPFPPGPFLPARGRLPRRGPGAVPGGLRPHAAPDGPPAHGG